ncbi:hypothetical protein FHS83_002673 [Rhizomicrobium palustre]|uniref:DUF3995 domain-containing protein n=1 Tax=Rhizomicrobium palustre TaxID=189966 RepID=A0A846N1L0_9PROT|nr:solute carrier organic anion transporter [Rhizomicrobium palustre]NIK89355.1 hypothetical protein [Rhizomicrobium palustre]
MPNSLKTFLLVCAAIAAWLMFTAAQTIYFPVPHPPITPQNAGVDDLLREGEITSALIGIIIALVLFNLATLIVFAKQGWLRFILAALVITRYVWPAVVTLHNSYDRFTGNWARYVNGYWSNPADFLWLAIWLVVIILPFLPDTRTWFWKRG